MHSQRHRKFPQTAFPVLIYLPKKKKKRRVKQNKYDCPDGLLMHQHDCAHEVKHCVPLTPPSSTRGSKGTVPTQQAQDRSQSWQDKRRQWSTDTNMHVCGRIEGGALGERSPSPDSSKYTKKASAQKKPLTLPAVLLIFSPISSPSVFPPALFACSSPCWVLHEPIRWMRPL